LKKQVCGANLILVELGLVLFTWGNVSGFDGDTGYMVIKPSGVPYEGMKYKDMVVMDMGGKIVEGDYRPSSDTATHIELYRHFKGIGGIVHTHSKWATIFSQAKKEIPYLGTTHVDNFYGSIPVTPSLTKKQVKKEYERETGLQIINTFKDKKINPLDVPAVLVANHAPFTWGKTAHKAVENAAVLEYAAEMAYYTKSLEPKAGMDDFLLDKHYLRKHGKDTYYGQK
jgi:L-ribulose-5-phosphate 4-epimerase